MASITLPPLPFLSSFCPPPIFFLISSSSALPPSLPAFPFLSLSGNHLLCLPPLPSELLHGQPAGFTPSTLDPADASSPLAPAETLRHISPRHSRRCTSSKCSRTPRHKHIESSSQVARDSRVGWRSPSHLDGADGQLAEPAASLFISSLWDWL